MQTIIMNISDDRSSAVDRVGFVPEEKKILVRFKNSGAWYCKYLSSEYLLLAALDRFKSPDVSFGKWAHFYNIFDEMTRIQSPFSIYGDK